jgi:GTP cyclohydrolase IB
MQDVQNQPDHRNIAIDKVGVKNIQYPITVLDKSSGTQNTVASIDMFVNLPQEFRGTHMSRFIEILNEHRGEVTIQTVPTILKAMRERLEAASAHVVIAFPYFMNKKAPVSGEVGLMGYQCRIHGVANHDMVLGIEVEVPITTLCPCSKEISKIGAHNQRGKVTVGVKFRRFLWIEDLIALVESSASCEVYSLLKRPDEKFVTEKAFNNPMFVEDVVRSIAEKLDRDNNVVWYAIECENMESIHNHNAYAFIERTKEPK